MRPCPICGHEGGLINCPNCHANDEGEDVTVIETAEQFMLRNTADDVLLREVERRGLIRIC